MIARMVGGARSPVNATETSPVNRPVLITAPFSRASWVTRMSPGSLRLLDDGSSDLTESSGGLC